MHLAQRARRPIEPLAHVAQLNLTGSLGSLIPARSYRLTCPTARRLPAVEQATALLEAAGGAVARSVPLQLSLNGQLFTPATQLSYLLQLPHNVTRFRPVSGPSDGGTTVALAGRALGGGADYRCRFGYHRVVPATYDVYTDTLSCVAPPPDAKRAALYAAVDSAPPPLATLLEVTLNGQQYTSDELPFTQYAPLRFMRLDPPSGGALGDTAVLVHFNTSGQRKPFEALQCRFGTAPPTLPVQHSSEWAVCLTPAAHIAGARALLHRLDFEGELAAAVLPPTDPSVKMGGRSLQYVMLSPPRCGGAPACEPAAPPTAPPAASLATPATPATPAATPAAPPAAPPAARTRRTL